MVFDHQIPQSIELFNETQQEAKKKKKKEKNQTKLHTKANVYNCLMNFSQNKAHATSTCKFQLTVRSDRCYFLFSYSVLLYCFNLKLKILLYDNFKRKTKKKTTTIINTIHQLWVNVFLVFILANKKKNWLMQDGKSQGKFLEQTAKKQKICKCIYSQYVKN